MNLRLSAGTGRFVRFCMVGAVGFIADAGFLVAAVALVGVSPIPGRAASFLFAATVTFLLNRRFTFGAGGRHPVAQWLGYVAATSGGALINLSIYLGWLALFGRSPLQLVIGTAFGSVAAMTSNFLVSSRVVFRRAAATGGTPSGLVR